MKFLLLAKNFISWVSWNNSLHVKMQVNIWIMAEMEEKCATLMTCTTYFPESNFVIECVNRAL